MAGDPRTVPRGRVTGGFRGVRSGTRGSRGGVPDRRSTCVCGCLGRADGRRGGTFRKRTTAGFPTGSTTRRPPPTKNVTRKLWLRAREANAAADPDYDRLVADAEAAATAGYSAFEDGDYERTVDRWMACRDAYGWALEIAISRGDEEATMTLEGKLERNDHSSRPLNATVRMSEYEGRPPTPRRRRAMAAPTSTPVTTGRWPNCTTTPRQATGMLSATRKNGAWTRPTGSSVRSGGARNVPPII